MNKLAIIKHLEGLADGSIEPVDGHGGVCAEFFRRKLTGIRTFHKFAKLWPKYSGVPRYPVPHPKITDPVNGFHAAAVRGLIWTGQYGATRRELCAFVAKRMREELE